MILVTVGTHILPFDRLVRAADELASLCDEPVIIQRGASCYMPRFAQHVDFVEGHQMERWLCESRILVSHAGAGSILGALRAGKPFVLAPRMARYGEHIDDHQLELAETLARQRRAVTIRALSGEALAAAIAQAAQLKPVTTHETQLHNFLRGWLAEQHTRRPHRRWWQFVRNGRA
jgi:beta-1,4-N-acetylglucosaminyltransferase